MSYEDPSRSKRNPVWLLMIALVVVAGGLWWWSQSQQPTETAPAAVEDPALAAPDPEFTIAPEGGVEVDLPEAAMTNVPAEDTAPESEDTSAN